MECNPVQWKKYAAEFNRINMDNENKVHMR